MQNYKKSIYTYYFYLFIKKQKQKLSYSFVTTDNKNGQKNQNPALQALTNGSSPQKLELCCWTEVLMLLKSWLDPLVTVKSWLDRLVLVNSEPDLSAIKELARPSFTTKKNMANYPHFVDKRITPPLFTSAEVSNIHTKELPFSRFPLTSQSIKRNLDGSIFGWLSLWSSLWFVRRD